MKVTSDGKDSLGMLLCAALHVQRPYPLDKSYYPSTKRQHTKRPWYVAINKCLDTGQPPHAPCNSPV